MEITLNMRLKMFLAALVINVLGTIFAMLLFYLQHAEFNPICGNDSRREKYRRVAGEFYRAVASQHKPRGRIRDFGGRNFHAQKICRVAGIQIDEFIRG